MLPLFSQDAKGVGGEVRLQLLWQSDADPEQNRIFTSSKNEALDVTEPNSRGDKKRVSKNVAATRILN